MKNKWHEFHTRKRTPFYVDIYTRGFFDSKRSNFLNFDHRIKLFFVDGEIVMRRSEFLKKRQALLVRLKKDPKFLLKLFDAQYRYWEKCLKLYDKIDKLNCGNLSNEKLAEWLTKYSDSIKDFWALGSTMMFVEDDLTKKISDYLAKNFSLKDANLSFGAFNNTLKEGVIGEEYRSLIETVAASQKDQTHLLQQHWENFAWMENQLFTNDFYPISYYENRLVELKRKNPKKLLEIYQNDRKKIREDYYFWLSKIRDKNMQISILTLNEAMFYRNWRQEKSYQSPFIVRNLLNEIARRLNISAKDLMFLIPEEIIRFLARFGKKTPVEMSKIIKNRKEGFVCIPGKKLKFLAGKQVKIWLDKISPRISPTKELKGTPSYAGKVRGIVKIVLSKDDFGKIEKGDILITPSTTPLYMPILHRVSAIVTEEGGILSHASIISRELKIPCVIGTKIATKVLKDGYMVEADADKGVVKILKRSKYE